MKKYTEFRGMYDIHLIKRMVKKEGKEEKSVKGLQKRRFFFLSFLFKTIFSSGKI